MGQYRLCHSIESLYTSESKSRPFLIHNLMFNRPHLFHLNRWNSNKCIFYAEKKREQSESHFSWPQITGYYFPQHIRRLSRHRWNDGEYFSPHFCLPFVCLISINIYSRIVHMIVLLLLRNNTIRFFGSFSSNEMKSINWSVESIPKYCECISTEWLEPFVYWRTMFFETTYWEFHWRHVEQHSPRRIIQQYFDATNGNW